jgi:hypothetical protein
MSITTIQLKKPEKHYPKNNIPQARNPTFKIKTRVRCDFCSGKSRFFKNLYQLHYHLLKNHEYEFGTRKYVMRLADQLIRGEPLS